MPHCEHYIAAQNYEPLLVTEEDIKEMQKTGNLGKYDCVTVLDKRQTYMWLFEYCPKCGEPINRRAIRARMKTFLKKQLKKAEHLS